MNRLLIFFSLSVLSMAVSAQNPDPHMNSWNPFVKQGTVSPAPLAPAELDGTGVLSFSVGNTGSTPLHLEGGYELTLEITLSKGLPDHPTDPLEALGGAWLIYFDWSYDAVENTYTGIQNQEIPGSDYGEITIAYRVTENSDTHAASNGFMVRLFPPSYTSGFNSDNDDEVSSYTYVLDNPVAIPLPSWVLAVVAMLMMAFVMAKKRLLF